MSRNIAGNNKGTWSNEEDAALLNAMDEVTKEIGHVKWCLVAKRLPSRSPKQCRERFVYNLDPNISKAPWTKEEDAFLLFSQKHLGNAWARIASCLPGRTENSTKTRFKSIMRAQKRIWKKYEDDYILSQFQIVGCQWQLIAQGLSGRTKNAIKTRYIYLTEGVGSCRTKEGVSSSGASQSSGDEVENDDQSLGTSDYVGNPSQALGLSDAELAQISATLSQKLSGELTSNTQSATQINQDTVKAAIALSPKPVASATASNNKRERPGTLKKTLSKSSVTGESGKFILETPKNFISPPKNDIPQISPSYGSNFYDINNVERLSKRQRFEIKEEPLSSGIPLMYRQPNLVFPRPSMDYCFDIFQHPNHFQESMSTAHFISPPPPPPSYLSNERPSFIEIMNTTFDYNNNFSQLPYGNDEGFGMNLGEIEPVNWNPTL